MKEIKQLFFQNFLTGVFTNTCPNNQAVFKKKLVLDMKCIPLKLKPSVLTPYGNTLGGKPHTFLTGSILESPRPIVGDITASSFYCLSRTFHRNQYPPPPSSLSPSLYDGLISSQGNPSATYWISLTQGGGR